MTHAAATSTAGATAAYGAIANAIKASGVIVEVESCDFVTILNRIDTPLVVHSPAGFLTKHKYLTSHKGLCFYTKTANPLALSSHVELIAAKKIWIPG